MREFEIRVFLEKDDPRLELKKSEAKRLGIDRPVQTAGYLLSRADSQGRLAVEVPNQGHRKPGTEQKVDIAWLRDVSPDEPVGVEIWPIS